ncbi:hypothetical protein ILUMI_02350 [Ignelater luminosus]|uniref:PiggyBac transposable element-derived protein domain-containing protein n=1 Tax=Ignelater luminosus TaxID=2038154 RepID=A0A8K0GKW9_IGNLU|nr:hypothetical protein ILUMI_02350 [Ignelater luminosus]
MRNVKRYSSKDKKQIFVTQPNIIHIYNDMMGDVDDCDQNLSLYRTSIRGKKWYFPLSTHCIDINNKDLRRFSKVSQMHHGSSRYDRLDDFAEFRENQRRCQKKVKVFCKKCDIALDVKNCFVQYHWQ